MIAWWGNEDFNYCYLIVPIVLYLIWEKKEQLAKLPARPSWMGLLPFMVGVSFFWLGELGGELYSMYVASWLIFLGLSWMHLGWEKLKIIWFPIAFLIAMFPPPNAINFPLTLQFKLLSSKIGVAIIQAYGLSAYREGNVIDLGFTQLQVVDACSGLRFLYPLIIMALLLAYFYRARFWKRAILVVSAVPITIVTNSLRIAMTGILYKHFGAAAAEGFFHGFSGWFIFMFALAILLLEMWVLNGFRGLFGNKYNSVIEELRDSGIEDKSNLGIEEFRDSGIQKNENQKKSNDSKTIYVHNVQNGPNVSNDLKGQTQNIKKQTSWMKSFFRPPQFIVAVLLLGATLVLAQGVEFREKIPMSRSFTEFPLQVGEWSGRRDVLEQKFIDELDFKDYIIVDYRNNDGKVVNFYTAYYDSQRKGESIHSPETCLPGGGWELKKAGRTTVNLNPSEMTINRAFIVLGAARQLTYFWFPVRDRTATSLWEVKLYNFWDALTRQRTDGALVRLVTPIYKDEDVAAADKRLVAFTKEIVPVLREFLPK
jgi:EpsI family protein